MLKLTETGIGLLTKQYRSVLRKCLIANLCILYPLTSDAQADAGYISTEAGYRTQVIKSSNGGNAISFLTDLNSGGIILHNTQHDLSKSYDFAKLLASQDNVGGILELKDRNNNTSYLTPTYFQLNNSGYATGIDFASNVTAGTTNASHLATTGAVNQLLNYYYTFRVDESEEVTDSASFFQKDFSTLQEVDLHIKNPTHLGAFTKCDEACSRPSERFVSSLSQEQMFKNNASVDAGTSRHCLRQFGDVVADLLKNTAAKGLRIYEFMNEEVCHA